jgi:signal transduction histidine kinase
MMAVAAFWIIAASLFNWLAVREEVNELLDETLSASATVLAGLLSTAPDAAAPINGNGGPAAPAGDGEFAWQLTDAGGAVLRRSARAPQAAFLPRATLGFSDRDQWRVLGVAFGPAGQVLYVAQTQAERREARGEVIVGAFAAAIAAGVLGWLLMRWLLRRELAPLDRLSRAVAAYDPLRADASLGAVERAEFSPVHQAIEALGARLAQRIEHERALAAHAAHALRTPLAGIDAQLAVAQREAAAELQPRLHRAREATARLQRAVAALLALFRGGVALQREPVELDELMARLPVAGLTVQAQGVVEADADLLSAAVLNLLDNASRHGARRVEVDVPAAQTLRLRDDGPGIDAGRRAALLAAIEAPDDAGRPADGVPLSGLGLGLRLADLVARAHGGRLRLPAAAAGFTVELALGGTLSSAGGADARPDS